MRKIFLILLIASISLNYSFAQCFSSDNFPILDLKSWSRLQALELNKEVGGNLSISQTSLVYSSNLNLIIKINEITRGHITQNNWEKNKKEFDGIINQRELVYKEVLTPQQYEKHQHAINKKYGGVNTNIQVSTSNEIDTASAATSYPTN